MKTVTVNETRTVEVTRYIAGDGRAFSSSWECIAYERKKKKRSAAETIRRMETCPEAEGLYPPGSYSLFSPSGCVWYRPSSEEEIDALNAYYSFDGNIPQSYAGRWICVISEAGSCPGEEPASWEDLGTAVSYIAAFLDAFGSGLADAVSLLCN